MPASDTSATRLPSASARSRRGSLASLRRIAVGDRGHGDAVMAGELAKTRVSSQAIRSTARSMYQARAR